MARVAMHLVLVCIPQRGLCDLSWTCVHLVARRFTWCVEHRLAVGIRIGDASKIAILAPCSCCTHCIRASSVSYQRTRGHMDVFGAKRLEHTMSQHSKPRHEHDLLGLASHSHAVVVRLQPSPCGLARRCADHTMSCPIARETICCSGHCHTYKPHNGVHLAPQLRALQCMCSLDTSPGCSWCHNYRSWQHSLPIGSLAALI